jgi:hypothetical protein
MNFVERVKKLLYYRYSYPTLSSAEDRARNIAWAIHCDPDGISANDIYNLLSPSNVLVGIRDPITRLSAVYDISVEWDRG